MGRTILCIDDDHETLKLRKYVLEASAYAVITASSGREAFQILSDGQSVDIVVLDYFMPEMKGDEVAKELRSQYPHVPIVVMSAFPDIPRALLNMVDGYVPKGQDPEVLIEVIGKALAKSNPPS
jgi:CheY-like chemotaxis protein